MQILVLLLPTTLVGEEIHSTNCIEFSTHLGQVSTSEIGRSRNVILCSDTTGTNDPIRLLYYVLSVYFFPRALIRAVV